MYVTAGVGRDIFDLVPQKACSGVLTGPKSNLFIGLLIHRVGVTAVLCGGSIGFRQRVYSINYEWRGEFASEDRVLYFT